MAVPALEAARANDLFLGEGTEYAGDDFESGIFVVFLQAVVFCNFLSV